LRAGNASPQSQLRNYPLLEAAFLRLGEGSGEGQGL
jgi:hypothetical protein